MARLDSDVIRLSDLDEATQKKVDAVDLEAAAARRDALRAAVDETLLGLEASRRGIPVKALLATEVLARTGHPTANEVAKEIADHPEKYKRGGDSREWAAGALYDVRFDALKRALITSIETRFPVTIIADVPLRGADDEVLATAGPRSLMASSVAARALAADTEIRIAAAMAEKEALDHTIDDRLLKAEAARRNEPIDRVVDEEVTKKIAAPTEADLRKAWSEWKSFFAPDFESARPAVLKFVERDRREQAEKEFHQRLRAGHTIAVLFEVPKRTRQAVDAGSSPASGDGNAAVTVVEWGDFQCPPCARMAEIVDDALRPYGNRVRYVFKQSPNSFHQYAWKAAEAALAANAQGKFFPYARLLFANQKDLGIPSLENYAKTAGLDIRRFNHDLESGRYAADVLWEKLEGESVGVRGTPFFFVNGVRLGFESYNVEGIRAVVDAAFRSGATDMNAGR